MLLQKTGWRIKQFISHRRNGSLEDYNENLKPDYPERKAISARTSANNSKRTSWISQCPPTDIAPLRRASSTATARSRPTPPMNSTAHSSASSLCSCECTANPASSNSLSVPALSRMEPRGEILYLPPVSSTSSGDAKTWRLIFPENPSRPRACHSRPDTKSDLGATNVRGSTFDLLQALSINPVDNDRTPTQSIRNMNDSDAECVSENVEQLIRETDEAFKAVGTALAGAKAATQAFHDDKVQEPLTRNVSVSREAFKKEHRPPVAPLKSPITRTKSVAKGKRKTFYRNKPNLLNRIRHVPPSANAPARWNLTDMTSNMVDIFNGKMFRTEVDEMLTPDRIQRMREEERLENERRISVESTRSTETDGSTPTEPFHLESLSSRITAAQLKESKTAPFPSPVLPPPATPSRQRSPTRKDVGAGKARVTELGGTDSAMEFQNLNFPAPPRIPLRSNARGTPPPLPTIHEVSPLDFIPRQSVYSKSGDLELSLESIQPLSDYILLPSTSFTLTSPLFRHGQIRIERKEKELLPDEELDWTAFQMAISGTMNEVGVDERDDIEWAADEAEVDDILEWWAGYRFPGYGRMVQGLPPSRSQWRKAELLALRTRSRNLRSDSGTDKIVAQEAGDGRRVKRGYAESMPPSPMLDLLPPSPTKGLEIIPMGYNLGHDLGDFLDWETHYVRQYFVDD